MSAVEFGLATPVFLAVLTPVIDLGLAFSQQIRVNQAVQAGAQYASTNPYAGTTWASNVRSAAMNATTLPITVTVGINDNGQEVCGCPNATNTTIAVNYGTPVSAGGTGCTGPCPDSSNPGYYVKVIANATYTSVMPYSMLGSSVTLSSQAFVRVE